MVACGRRTVATVLAGLAALALGCGSNGGSGSSAQASLAQTLSQASHNTSAPASTSAQASTAPKHKKLAFGSLPVTINLSHPAATNPAPAQPAAPAAAPSAPAATASLDFEVEVPSWTPSGQIWIAVDQPLGTLPAWSANGWGLSQDQNGRWVGSMPVAPGTVVHCKVTRGTWDTVEKGPAIEEISDRVLVAGQGATHCFLHVYHWGDDTIPNATGNVIDLGTFAPKNGLPARTVVAHLPPGYDDPANANVRYPVLYALDGQNLFDPNLSFTGVAWGLDTACDDNVYRGRGAFICIGIYNTSARMDEYTPSYDSNQQAGGKCEDLATWLFTECKPAIDALYRTSPSPDDTGLMGSSLGGLAALNIGWHHPEWVRRIAALSPSLWWNNEDTLALISGSTIKPPLKIWLDIGTNEDGRNSQQTVDQTRSVLHALEKIGFVQTVDLAYEEQQGATHSESAWASRLPDVVSFQFP